MDWWDDTGAFGNDLTTWGLETDDELTQPTVTVTGYPVSGYSYDDFWALYGWMFETDYMLRDFDVSTLDFGAPSCAAGTLNIASPDANGDGIDDQAQAEDAVEEALELLEKLQDTGDLPNSAQEALDALQGVTVTNAKSGLNEETGVFNLNAAEYAKAISDWSNQTNIGSVDGTSIDRITLIIASHIIHDAHHAVQADAGSGLWTLFPNPGDQYDNTISRLIGELDGDIDTSREIELDYHAANFATYLIQHERNAQAVEIEFLRALQGFVPQEIIDEMIEHVNGQSNEDIIGRYLSDPDQQDHSSNGCGGGSMNA